MQRSHSPPHRRRRPRSRGLEDGRLVRVQQPGPAGARDGRAGSARSRTRSATRPHPVARMLTQRQTPTIGLLTPQALSVIFSNPFFGAFSEGVALAAEEHGLRAPLHLPCPRLAWHERSAARRSTASWPSASATTIPRSNRSGGQACRSSSSIRPRSPSTARSRSTTSEARERQPSTSSPSAIATSSSSASNRRRPRRTLDPDGVTGRRLRGYRDAFAGGGVVIGDERVVVGPASIDGGVAALKRAWDDGLRPTGVLAMSDAMAIGAMRAAARPSTRRPGRRQRRRLRRHRPRAARGPAAHDGPPTDPSQGRRGGPPAPAVVEKRTRPKAEHRRLETRLIIRGSTGPAPDTARPAPATTHRTEA